MNQSEDIKGENFWEVVIERQWQATMTRDDKTFYAPWCMERHTLSSEYHAISKAAQFQHSGKNPVRLSVPKALLSISPARYVVVIQRRRTPLRVGMCTTGNVLKAMPLG